MDDYLLVESGQKTLFWLSYSPFCKLEIKRYSTFKTTKKRHH